MENHEMLTSMSEADKWRTTFLRLKRLPWRMWRAPPQETDILLTDFAAAYQSVNHSWSFHVLEKAGLPEFIRRFFRMIYCNSTTQVEFAAKTRRHLSMARGVRQGCPVSGFLFAMAFDPIICWLHSSVIPRDPAGPDFLPPCSVRLCWLFSSGCFVLSVVDDRSLSCLQGGGPICRAQPESSEMVQCGSGSCHDLLDWVSPTVRSFAKWR